MTDLTQAVHTYLTTAPTSQFVGAEVEIRSHWQGADNLLWHVVAPRGEAVLKLFLDAGQARSRRQFDGQQLFGPLGLAPQPLWVDRYPEGLSRQVLVYRWVNGDPWIWRMLARCRPLPRRLPRYTPVQLILCDASARDL